MPIYGYDRGGKDKQYQSNSLSRSDLTLGVPGDRDVSLMVQTLQLPNSGSEIIASTIDLVLEADCEARCPTCDDRLVKFTQSQII